MSHRRRHQAARPWPRRRIVEVRLDDGRDVEAFSALRLDPGDGRPRRRQRGSPRLGPHDIRYRAGGGIGSVPQRAGGPETHERSRMTKLRLEAVECFERDVQSAPAVPLRRHHGDALHPGDDPRHRRARGRPHERRRRRRDAGRQVVRQEPGLQPTRRTWTSCASRWPRRSTSIARRGGARPSASTPAPMPSSRRAVPISAWCRWWPPTDPRCSTAPSSMRSAAPRASPSPQMISRNVAGIGTTELTPDLAGFDLPRFLGGLKAGPDIAVRHTVGLVDPIVAADQKPGERVNDGLPETLEEVVAPLSRSLLQAEGWRQHRGRPRPAEAHRRRARSARPATTARRSTATSSTTTSRASPSCGAACARRRRSPAWSLSTLFIEQPIKRAAALTEAGRRAGAVETAHHR